MRRAATALAAISLALFVLLNLAFVMSWGVCCADDALFATVAKNLAWGFGYSSSLGHGPNGVLERFEVNITTGPTLILPVSGAVRLLGNQFWVPGAVQVTLWTVLLVAVWRALGAVASRGRAGIVGALFLLVIYSVSPYHFEHWFAMLGEVPAALALVLSLTIWAAHPESRQRCFFAAMLCSLAVVTKLLAVIYAATFLAAAVVVVGLSGHRELKHLWRLLGPFLVGFLVPILAFEAWKAALLGGEAYLAHLRGLAYILSNQGTSHSAFWPAEITTRLIAFSTRFGVSLPGLLVLAVFGGSLVWRTGSPAFRRLYLVLGAGIVVHTCYWLVLSIGWPRYIYMGVILLCALVSIPYLALEGRGPIMLYSAALALSLLGTVGRLHGPIAGLGGAWFAPSTFRLNQDSVVRFLDARLDRRPFVGQWAAPVADLEYLSKGVLGFKGYSALTLADLSRGVLVVTNSRFHDAGDKQFSSFVTSCGQPVLAAAPYAIHECGARVVPTPAPADVQGGPSVATVGCNLEHVSPVTLSRGDVLRLGGWIVNEQEHSVPMRPYVMLQSIGTGASWYAAFAAGLRRGDVARARRQEAYHASGFVVSIDTTALPPGEYRLALRFRDSGPTFTCTWNDHRIVLR
jgi:hypothetical protein